MRRIIISLVVLLMSGSAALSVRAQEAPSLGDVARQARAQKQKKEAQADKDGATPAKDSADTGAKPDAAKDAPTAAAKDVTPKPAKRVITNDEIPEHIGPTSTNPPTYRPQYPNYPRPNYPNYPNYPNHATGAADQWKASILAMKDYIANMQAQIANLEQSVHYDSACVSRCVQWNEHQRQKQEQAEALKQQLDQQQKNLENMQEQARRQGFGSSVYDP